MRGLWGYITFIKFGIPLNIPQIGTSKAKDIKIGTERHLGNSTKSGKNFPEKGHDLRYVIRIKFG